MVQKNSLLFCVAFRVMREWSTAFLFGMEGGGCPLTAYYNCFVSVTLKSVKSVFKCVWSFKKIQRLLHFCVVVVLFQFPGFGWLFFNNLSNVA